MFFLEMAKRQVLKKGVSLVLSIAFALTLIVLSGFPATSVQAEPGDPLGILEIEVNKPVHAVVDLNKALINISLPYGTLYQMLNVRTNPGAAATLYRSNGTTAISFAASGINKGDAKLDQFSTSGTTFYYLKVADKNDSNNSRTYTILVKVELTLPPIPGMGASQSSAQGYCSVGKTERNYSFRWYGVWKLRLAFTAGCNLEYGVDREGERYLEPRRL